MRSEGILKHILFAFLLALGVYALFYYAIEHRRTSNGPWEISFIRTGADFSLVVNQSALGITNVQLKFSNTVAGGANASSTTLLFNQAREVPFDLPFGKCVFLDTTFLPGPVTLNVLGHEVQFLPRVLIIDQAEYRWRSGETIPLAQVMQAPSP